MTAFAFSFALSSDDLISYQTTLAGVLRSLGGQIYGSIAILVAFYVIGAPIGIALSLKTSMLIEGFLVGFMVGCSVLALAQIVYIYRASWAQVAQRVSHIRPLRTLRKNTI